MMIGSTSWGVFAPQKILSLERNFELAGVIFTDRKTFSRTRKAHIFLNAVIFQHKTLASIVIRENVLERTLNHVFVKQGHSV